MSGDFFMCLFLVAKCGLNILIVHKSMFGLDPEWIESLITRIYGRESFQLATNRSV